MANQSGQDASMIGSYRLLKLVGFGPISRLYLAQRDTHPQELLALKLVETTPRAFQQAYRHRFFFQETERLMHLTHRSLLPLQDAGIHEGFPYLVYPYIKSGSLSDYLASRQLKRLPLDEALELIYQLGKALEIAHQAQIVHGNIKPGNIFLLAEDAKSPTDTHLATRIAALADFTIDAVTRGLRTARLQSPIAARYMAPEQFWGTLSIWSDQYSLACLAYELLTGKPLFPTQDFHTLEKMHANQQPIRPGLLVPGLSQATEEVLLRALSKHPGDRYPDMGTFLLDLSTPPGILRSEAPQRYTLNNAACARPLIPTGKLVLPLLPPEKKAEGDESSVTQSIQVISSRRRSDIGPRKQTARGNFGQPLLMGLNLLIGYLLAFCSFLGLWCGELWSVVRLLFLVIRDRLVMNSKGQLWKEMQENNAHVPAVNGSNPVSIWQSTFLSSWQQGITRNRRRWRKKLVNPN
jgi:serine/threonine protein kinase